MSRYDRHREKRSQRIRARDRRIQRTHGARIEIPIKVQASCAGCLRDIPVKHPVYRRGEVVYCSTDCLVAGRHWVDPSLCGGCGGAHRLGVRP